MSKLKAACRTAVKNLKGSYDTAASVSTHFTSAGTLKNKLSEAKTHNQFHYSDALEIYDITGDERIPQAMCADFGGVYIPDMTGERLNPDALIMRGLDANDDTGSLCKELYAALGDHRIDPGEYDDLMQKLQSSKQAIADIERCIKEHGDRP